MTPRTDGPLGCERRNVQDVHDCGCHVDIATSGCYDPECCGDNGLEFTARIHYCEAHEAIHEPIRRVAEMFAETKLVEAERYVEMQLSILAADRLSEGVRQVVEDDFKVPMMTPNEYLRALRDMYRSTREHR